MITHRTRYLVPLTAVAAVALGGLSMTSATAATTTLPDDFPAATQAWDPANPGKPPVREHTVYFGYAHPGQKVYCIRSLNHCTKAFDYR
ncbi:hypothetical protein ACFYYS_06855 [Streptomyces sp. NPDC002120]|uniref:hypothetical protein n=1 Tax=Streptomyces sp. NPDC002120 TaxID=3364631 RepID=UPI00368F6F5C